MSVRIPRRQFVKYGVAGTTALLGPLASSRAVSANGEIRVGFISCGSRAGGLMSAFEKIGGVRIVGLCDPDQSRLESAHNRFPQAKTWKDLRGLLDHKDIDAVVVATCNHWHCLAAIWAMQAGKDVYVEKPLSHSQWEGQQAVLAAKKYERICQVGTQQRSDPMQAEIKQFLHRDHQLGAVTAARVNRYGIRAPIGRRSEPLRIPASVDFNLWLGPAAEQPIFRDKLQYDWHWDWNTGSGEMGNWGVHVLDDMRNNVLQDKVALPKRMAGGGGRLIWKDAGQTPNVHLVYFDTGSIPVVVGLSNLPAQPGAKKTFAHPGPGSGYIAYCEGGRLEGQRGRAAAFDRAGKLIKSFKGDAGKSHQQNFVDALRARDPSRLNAPIEMGHLSTGWCNLANIAFRAGSQSGQSTGRTWMGAPDWWRELVEQTNTGLAAYSTDLGAAGVQFSSMLELDNAQGVFVGPDAVAANRFLRRKYRAPFVVPDIRSA